MRLSFFVSSCDFCVDWKNHYNFNKQMEKLKRAKVLNLSGKRDKVVSIVL